MSTRLEQFEANVDRRFAILMTALQDWSGAYQAWKNEVHALLDIQKKAVQKKTSQKQEEAPLIKTVGERKKRKHQQKQKKKENEGGA